MKRRVLFFLPVILIAGMILSLFLAAGVLNDHFFIHRTEPSASLPLDLSIDSGSLSNGTGLDTSLQLDRDNGNYVRLSVENNGSNSVVATINGQSAKTFQPGEKGHIYTEVTKMRIKG